MAFTDDDLQVIKEAVKNGELNLPEFFEALLSRLDAAEKALANSEYQEANEFFEAWLKSKGAA